MSHDEHLPEVASDHGTRSLEEPIPNPGLPPHRPRPTDVDPKAEKRAERQVATLFGLSAICTLIFFVCYFALDIGETTDTIANLGASNVGLGLSLGGALLFIGVGVIQWARKLMSDVEIVEISAPHFEYGVAAYYLILPAEASSNLAKFDSVRFGLRVDVPGGTVEDVMAATRDRGFGANVAERRVTSRIMRAFKLKTACTSQPSEIEVRSASSSSGPAASLAQRSSSVALAGS